ncbi:MAG: ABC transporter ATP-binding protein [Deltaproteobacteria bacterium]|nr:ABC transporter ATP-binding protein [Deltaproteobacteria bacterium]
MTEPLIRLTGVCKEYLRGEVVLSVLHEVTLDIAPAEFMALIGPSGSGKSTLLNLIAGIDKPTRGEITIGGNNIAMLSEQELAQWRAHSIGFIFQFYNLIPVLTAVENVELPLYLRNMKAVERKERASLALSLVNMSHRLEHYPRELSGGEQQRVAIARAVVTDPQIIVADEPTGDLDRTSAQEALNLLKFLNSEMGKTIIMVTHDLRAAQEARVTKMLDKGFLSDATN